MKNLVFVLTVFFFLTGARAWAADKPFNSADLKDPSLCKYTSRIEHDGHADGDPRLFENVKRIYINVPDNMLFLQGLQDVSILKPDNIAIIAACALQKQIGDNPPIYIPEDDYAGGWTELYEDSNLLIKIGVYVDDGRGFYQNLFSQKLVSVYAYYFRPDVHLIENLNFYCLTAFPYTDDKELLQKLLTRALTGCVDRPYYEN